MKKYDVKFQTSETYRDEWYGGNTIFNSACGPSALCNCMLVLLNKDITIREMAKYSVSVGARVDGGTDEYTLLKNASKKFGFRFETTSLNKDLRNCLKQGGVAILHGGDAYKLFSSGGHFVAAVDIDNKDIVTVFDSYWYDGKYTSTALRRANTKVQYKGCITTPLVQCGKATVDRRPSYYLITKPEEVTFKVKTITDCKIRKLAGKNHQQIGTLKAGKTATIVDTTANWYKLSTGGWVPKKHVKKIII